MTPAGLVDADNRVDLADLQRDGVRALALYAVEALYYQSEVVDAVLNVAGTEASLEDVLSSGCRSATDEDLKRFAHDASYRAFRHAYLRRLPSTADFEGFSGHVELAPDRDFDSATAILTHLRTLRDHRDWDALVAAVKLKACRAPKVVAGKLKYSNPGAYELAARKVLKERLEILKSLRQLVPDPFL